MEKEKATEETDFFSDEETWSSYSSEVKEAKDVTLEIKVEEINPAIMEFNFSSFGKPDPFIPPLVDELFAKLEIPITSPLQKYPVLNLRVAGIWTMGNGERKALIMTPEDEGIISKVDDPVGRKGGKIIDIETNLVKIREFTASGNGVKEFQDTELPLGKAYQDKNYSLNHVKKNIDTSDGDTDGYIENEDEDVSDASYDLLQMRDASKKELSKGKDKEVSAKSFPEGTTEKPFVVPEAPMMPLTPIPNDKGEKKEP